VLCVHLPKPLLAKGKVDLPLSYLPFDPLILKQLSKTIDDVRLISDQWKSRSGCFDQDRLKQIDRIDGRCQTKEREMIEKRFSRLNANRS
jgi:hypothetical protein